MTERLDSAEFCRRVFPQLLGALTLYVGRRDLAEELTQDVIVRALAAWARISGGSNPEAYVMRMGFNAANSWYRRRSAERRAYSRSVLRPPDTVDVAARVAVRAAVLALPPRQRMALILRYYEDLSVEQTSEVMGCAHGTVKAHVAKAITALRASDLVDEEMVDNA